MGLGIGTLVLGRLEGETQWAPPIPHYDTWAFPKFHTRQRLPAYSPVYK